MQRKYILPRVLTILFVMFVTACIVAWARPAEAAERFFVDGVENQPFPAFIDGLKACRDIGNGPGSGCNIRITYAQYSDILQEKGNVPSDVDDVIKWLEENTRVGKPTGELTLYGIGDGGKLVVNTRLPRKGEMIVYDNETGVQVFSLNCANPIPKIDIPMSILPTRKPIEPHTPSIVVRNVSEAVWVTTWGTSSHAWGYGEQSSQWSTQNSHRRFR